MKSEVTSKAMAPFTEDADLSDQAAMCASMLLTLAERWRSRAQTGRLGSHSIENALQFAQALESAAAELDSVRPPRPPPRAELRLTALEDSEARFRLLVDAVKEYAIYLLDTDGHVVSWNSGAERIKGYGAEDVLGKHFRMFYTPDAVAARHPEYELEVAQRDGTYQEEGWRVRKDGTQFFASVVITPLTDRGGRLVGYAKVTRDITERVEQEERLRRSAADLEVRVEQRTQELIVVNQKLEAAFAESKHAVRMREEILAVVSHDLRNPLAAIHMAAALLLLKSDGDPNTRKQAETIQRSASRMEHLLSDLLDMASLQAGRLALERKPEDPVPLVGEVFDLHEPMSREKGLVLRRNVELSGVRVDCDRDRVLQIFGNLIGNAIKLCQSGDVISLGARLVDGAAQFAITDTGPGIPEQELPHLFEPYWSADRHARKGTGLGLYISKGIVEAHGGRLWVESQYGVGSTFYFTIPLAAPRP